MRRILVLIGLAAAAWAQLPVPGSGGGTGSGGAGSGEVTVQTGTGDPNTDSETCTVSSTSFCLYVETALHEVWMSVNTNTWKKILDTTNTGPIAIVGPAGSSGCAAVPTGVVCAYIDSTTGQWVVLDENEMVLYKTPAPGSCIGAGFLKGFSTAGVADCSTPSGGATNQFTTSVGGVALFSDVAVSNSYNGLSTNNIVLYIEYVPKVTADLKIIKINTGGALAPQVAAGFMDSTCSTLLATSNSQTFTPGGYLTLTFPTAVSVVAGTPYFFMISTYANSGVDAQFAWDHSGAGIPTIMNQNSPLRMFTDSSRSTGTSTLTLPSACSGTRVAANITMPVIWAVR